MKTSLTCGVVLVWLAACGAGEADPVPTRAAPPSVAPGPIAAPSADLSLSYNGQRQLVLQANQTVLLGEEPTARLETDGRIVLLEQAATEQTELARISGDVIALPNGDVFARFTGDRELVVAGTELRGDTFHRHGAVNSRVTSGLTPGTRRTAAACIVANLLWESVFVGREPLAEASVLPQTRRHTLVISPMEFRSESLAGPTADTFALDADGTLTLGDRQIATLRDDGVIMSLRHDAALMGREGILGVVLPDGRVLGEDGMQIAEDGTITLAGDVTRFDGNRILVQGQVLQIHGSIDGRERQALVVALIPLLIEIANRDSGSTR